MTKILSQLAAAQMLARDWHYSASGAAFYAEHLLADRVAEIAGHADKLKEVFWLGEKGRVPPTEGVVMTDAIEAYNRANGESIPQKLADVLRLLAAHAEELARDTSISIGSKSLLDGICADAYQFVGLIQRTEMEA